jgi:hypothetical protein
MLTPILIQAFFWVGLLGIAIYAFIAFGAMALIAIPFLAVFWRVYCEMLIVIFRILDVLTDIRNKP